MTNTCSDRRATTAAATSRRRWDVNRIGIKVKTQVKVKWIWTVEAIKMEFGILWSCYRASPIVEALREGGWKMWAASNGSEANFDSIFVLFYVCTQFRRMCTKHIHVSGRRQFTRRRWNRKPPKSRHKQQAARLRARKNWDFVIVWAKSGIFRWRENSSMFIYFEIINLLHVARTSHEVVDSVLFGPRRTCCSRFPKAKTRRNCARA